MDDFEDLEAFSKALLEREQAYHRKNQELKTQTKLVLKSVQDVVKEGKQILERPLTSPNVVSEAAENDLGPSKKRGESAKLNAQMSGKSMKAHGHGKVTVKPMNLKKEDPLKDALMGLPEHMTEDDLGSEATTRFLKAKLVVLQQELDKLVHDRNQKDTAIALLQEQVKLFEDDKAKLTKVNASLSSQTDKTNKRADEAHKRAETLETQVQKLKKEVEILSRHTKQTDQDAHTKDVRLNRALEEIEKHKIFMNKLEVDYKDKVDVARKTSESLFNENKRLEKQKSELLAVFKKQSQLIDVLKRQKMHIEAAKLLQFTEEEFLRALNWDQ